jgi:hypothetical protein
MSRFQAAEKYDNWILKEKSENVQVGFSLERYRVIEQSELNGSAHNARGNMSARAR